MGWYFTKTLGGCAGPREYLNDQLSSETGEDGNRVLCSTIVNNVYYAALERTNIANERRQVSAVVCHFRYDPTAFDSCIFGYKKIEEEAGPNACDCPAAILDLLTPTYHHEAARWRAECRTSMADLGDR